MRGEETRTRIEIDAPAKPKSILVLQGPKVSQDQIAAFREAVARDEWPLILNYPGPVYWVPIREEEEDGAAPTL